MILAKLNGKELPDKPTIKWFKGKWLELVSKSGARFSFKESHDPASNVRTLWGLEGLWARAGGRVELLGRGCAGQEGRMFGPGQGALGHGVCVPRELSGSGTQAPRGQDCPGMGRDSWPFLGALRESCEVGSGGGGVALGVGHVHPYPWPGPQVYALELHIGKVVLGDRGDYRLEVKAKDICDSCAFKIDVEGMLAGVGARGLGSGWGDGSVSQVLGECTDVGIRRARVFGRWSREAGLRLFKIGETVYRLRG